MSCMELVVQAEVIALCLIERTALVQKDDSSTPMILKWLEENPPPWDR
jgi:hypothetical protein